MARLRHVGPYAKFGEAYAAPCCEVEIPCCEVEIPCCEVETLCCEVETRPVAGQRDALAAPPPSSEPG